MAGPFAKPLPLVASICGTFLKPEMQSVYRQITGLRRHRTAVFTEKRLHAEEFPFEPVIVMEKPVLTRAMRRKLRPRGNFIRRFYYKHLLKQWPPPERPRPAAPPPLPLPVRDLYNLVDLLKARRPALAHVYYGHKAVKFLPMLQRWGGPLVVSFHGLDVTEAIYKSTYEASLGDVFEHARLILARSQSLLSRLRALGCPEEKLRLNRAGIPLDRIPRGPARQPPTDGKWRLLQACRLIPKKGLATTLTAMRQVVDEWPQARLAIAGNGPLAEPMRALAAELGLQAHVEFTGWCAQDQLLELYRDAHLFLHPSETTESGDQEGVPNSLLEAMAAGLPIVATRHGGIPEAVRDGVDGLLVPERAAGPLAGAIARIMADAALLGAMSEQAGLNVERNFGMAGQVSALEDCYEEAMRR